MNECVRRANTAHQEAGTLGALFSAAAVGVRAKLREACERVILMFPGSQDHQVEETLWRKVYYQPLHSAKELRKVCLLLFLIPVFQLCLFCMDISRIWKKT